jgi:hypothetical protein
MQNITNVAPIVEKNAKMGPAKNRTSHITEAFEALPLVEGFPLTTEQLWEYFNKAAKSKDIKIRKLSVKGEGKKSAENGPKRLTGYNLFTKEFSCEIPDGIGVMTHKASIWKVLSDEKKKEFNERATAENLANGIEPTVKKITYEQLQETYWDELEKWASEDSSTRGPKPERPEKKTRKKKKDTSSDSSEISD